ncbi:AhpC/TSA family protein [Carboxylicivirga sediminis]|uniref:AhpC/TSA family protein n=1 Tax=Carboxylicivirga sediminis TaxID=2006564 RepID=A0A941IYX0_9BACT|nr:TlpA disulfide reductase family protein [Carboxylicivirga sediminis]MBR8536217.1 AhpC/TSA family protein [Carboxylicivirga sediminis]
MKNLLFVAVTVIAVLASCQPQAPAFKLSGKIDGAADKVVTISVYDKDGVNVKDTLTITDGVVNYSTELTEPVFVMVGEAGTRNTVNFFAENVDYTINGSLDAIKDAEVTGGAVFNVYKSVSDMSAEINAKSDELKKAYGEAGQAGDTAKQRVIYEEYQANQEKFETAQLDVVKANPASPASAFIISNVYGYGAIEEMKEGLAMLDASLANSTYYISLSEKIAKLEAVAVGKMAPDFTMNDPEGNPVSLSSFKGKYLLVDFWASWCGPCRRENPHVVELYAEFKDKGFDILGVSLDQKEDAWLKAIEDDKLTWNHVSDLKGWGNEAAKLYAVSGIPHTVLLDKDGKIIAKNLRGDELRAKVAELLN